jgi:hypothetical protein
MENLKKEEIFQSQAGETVNALDWKSKIKLMLYGMVSAASIAAVVSLFVVPGAQVLLIGPLLVMGVPKIAAIAATVAQFVGMALTSVGIARGIVKFTDIVLGPVRMVASAVKFAAEVVLGILSPILPNIWLAKSYAFLNNLIYKINGVKNLECKAKEQKIEKNEEKEPLLYDEKTENIPASTTLNTGQKVLNFFKNVAFGILTPIAKVGIFVGNLVFNLLLMPIDMYIKPFMTKWCAKKVNKGISYVNSKFGEGLDAMSNSQMHNPVIGTRCSVLQNRIPTAIDKSNDINRVAASLIPNLGDTVNK